jgi:transglutaminase-like putative cysteine protease
LAALFQFGLDPEAERQRDRGAREDQQTIPLTVHHRTVYRYRQSVDLWPHRLMLCPRESRDLQVISCVVLPTARTTWAHDIFGNAVATAVFQGASDSLVIDSVVELRLEATAWPIFNIAASAITYPFRYSDDEWTDLGALTRQQSPDAGGRLAAWARAFVCGDRTDTLALLKDLIAGVSEALRYHSRDDEGTQSPIETLARGWGSCRDFAVLFVSVDGANLIPVAVARDIHQAPPIVGAYAGSSDALESMSVEVLVTSPRPRLAAQRGPLGRADQFSN